MNESSMRSKIDEVLADMELRQLEDRIAPVKCEKNPDAPECMAQPEYGVALYGVEPMYGVEPEPDAP